MACNSTAVSKFVHNRPKSIASFGYGSSFFHQVSYNDSSNPQIDIIFVVDNLKEWHLANIEKNPLDYSFTGKLYLSLSSIKRIKGHNNITYFSQIEEGGKQFKYGVIEVDDFKRGLSTWDNIFIAGRFHKPVYNITNNSDFDDAINLNRKYALVIACLFSSPYTDVVSLLEKIVSLSYAGDTRMLLAENPYKISNIVLGNTKLLSEMYIKNNEFLRVRNSSNVSINHFYILNNLDSLLPPALFDYLAFHDTDLRKLSQIRKRINEFITSHNREESASQTLEGFRTNGVVRSIPYIKSKVKKRFENVNSIKKSY